MCVRCESVCASAGAAAVVGAQRAQHAQHAHAARAAAQHAHREAVLRRGAKAEPKVAGRQAQPLLAGRRRRRQVGGDDLAHVGEPGGEARALDHKVQVINREVARVGLPNAGAAALLAVGWLGVGGGVCVCCVLVSDKHACGGAAPAPHTHTHAAATKITYAVARGHVVLRHDDPRRRLAARALGRRAPQALGRGVGHRDVAQDAVAAGVGDVGLACVCGGGGRAGLRKGRGRRLTVAAARRRRRRAALAIANAPHHAKTTAPSARPPPPSKYSTAYTHLVRGQVLAQRGLARRRRRDVVHAAVDLGARRRRLDDVRAVQALVGAPVLSRVGGACASVCGGCLVVFCAATAAAESKVSCGGARRS